MSNLEAMEEAGRRILQRLESCGYQAYFVGGYVRDKLAGRPIADIDIATSAKPEAVMSLFPKHAATGLKHGTVTVLADDYAFEVTTFRVEDAYEHYRRPTAVSFVDNIVYDLQRRDFTINAMAIGLDGHVLDPFGGQQDLQQRLLRSVGKAADRFSEDALRMIRCVRFAAEYELTIESNTWRALQAHGAKLRHIAMERIRMELVKMLQGAHPARALQLLYDSGLLRHLKDDPRLPLDRWGQLVSSKETPLELLHQLPDLICRLFALFKLLQMTADEACTALRVLTFSNKQITDVTHLLSLDEQLMPFANDKTGARVGWIKGVLRYGKQAAWRWQQTLRVLALMPNAVPEIETVRFYLNHGSAWTEAMAVSSMKDLAVNGNDLRSLGVKAGPWIGDALEQVLLATASGDIANDRDAQLSFVKTRLSEKDKLNE